MHDSIGHLGIFVSGKVATREHNEFVSCMDLIDVLPPGLYEAVITEVDEDTINADLVQGRYLFRLEARKLDDIRALGGNDAADDRRFATVARVSEINRGLYETFVAPTVRLASTEKSAETFRALHPNRLRFAMFSDQNPVMRPVKAMASAVRAARKPVSTQNPLLAMEHAASSWITACLQNFGELRDAAIEAMFCTFYGSPVLQSLVGVGALQETPRRIERDLVREAEAARLQSYLERRFDVGGPREAVLRALIYIRLPEASVDERGFEMLKLMRLSQPRHKRLTMAQFKEIAREQYLLLRLDEERAIRTLPTLLGRDARDRTATLDALRRVLGARGELSREGARRLAQIEVLFAGRAAKSAKRRPTRA
jgi:hypothetical protein